MSFGVGASDFVTIPLLAWTVYKACRDSSEEFQRISKEVSLLHVVLKETEELLQEYKELTPSRKERLLTITAATQDILKELQELLNRHDSMATSAQRTWDRLRWGLQDVSAIRSRLISVTTTLGAFNASLANCAQLRVEKRLNKFMKEVRAGLHEGSIVSVSTVDSLSTKETWQELRKELEDVGISAAVINENQQFITKWFQEAVSKGLLEEGDPEESKLTRTPSPLSILSPSTTLVDDASTYAYPPPQSRKASEVSTYLSFPTLRRSSSVAVHTKKSRIGSLVFKLFKSDASLLEAASDGDTQRVADLIAKGANINVQDRWKWRPMSMAAYGGYEDIARLLMDAGAELDYEDVDGDSPLTLATNKGHTAVVLMIQDEVQARQIRDA